MSSNTNATPSLESIAKPTFKAWERLRPIYVLSLGLLTILLAGPNLAVIRTIVLIIEGVIVANVCYFAGPIVETYIRWLGYEKKWVRWVLFVCGTLFAAILAVVTMVTHLVPF